MVQTILEQLVNGTPPVAISPKITSQSALVVPGLIVIVKKLPITNFIQSCWTILRIIGDTIAGYCIEKV